MAASNDPYENVEDDDYIKVSVGTDDEFMEIPKEEDGTVMLSTIQTQFPDAIGLRCKGSSGAWRAIRAVDNRLAAPKGGWGEKIYCVTVAGIDPMVADTRKRKNDTVYDRVESKRPATDPLLKDMLVTGLPYSTTTDELKEYFENNYGDVAFCEVKYRHNRVTDKSRGFGFVRFKDIDCAKEAVKTEHDIGGRKVMVKQTQDKPMKLFIGRLPQGATKEDLENYFSKYGELQDVYVPTPFRNIAFITYSSTDDGKHVLRDTHVLDGASLNVEERKPDERRERNDGYMANGYQQAKYSNDRKSDMFAKYGNNRQSDMLAKDGNDRKSDISGDLKNMLFQLLTK